MSENSEQVGVERTSCWLTSAILPKWHRTVLLRQIRGFEAVLVLEPWHNLISVSDVRETWDENDDGQEHGPWRSWQTDRHVISGAQQMPDDDDDDVSRRENWQFVTYCFYAFRRCSFKTSFEEGREPCDWHNVIVAVVVISRYRCAEFRNTSPVVVGKRVLLSFREMVIITYKYTRRYTFR